MPWGVCPPGHCGTSERPSHLPICRMVILQHPTKKTEFAVDHLPLHPAQTLEVPEMCQGLAAREPLLGKGERFPAFALDVPGHPGGGLVRCKFFPLQEGEDLFVSRLVVLLQLVDPAAEICERLPVAGQHLGHVIPAYFVEALQVKLQRVVCPFGPQGNVGGDAQA